MAQHAGSGIRRTRDHDEIRRWASARGGRPARFRSAAASSAFGVTLVFGAITAEDPLEPISWEEFFDRIDRNGLALVYAAESGPDAASSWRLVVA